MFNFLNSTVLLAAAAALIPLIIHLFSRRRVKIVEFSSLRHLKAMQKRQVRRLKIRQILLLAVRMLIVLTVVMAFARPTTKSGGVGSHASVSAVILFDNSASMTRYVTDGNLFDIAKKRTAELLETFGQSDQVALIPLNRSNDDVTGAQEYASAAVAKEQLELIKPGYGEADLESALEYAADLIQKAGNLNREIYIVSDRQRNALPQKEPLAEVAAAVYTVDLPLSDDDNCGVVSVDFGGQLIQPGLDFDVVATIRNYGSEIESQSIASLFMDGKRVAQTEFSVGAGSETGVRFTRAVAGTGFHSGYVEISDDPFLADNRYYFSFHIPERFNLLIVTGDPSGQFISLALVPNETLSRYWSVKEATPDQLSGVDFLDYDVIMLVGAPLLNQTYVSRLKSIVERGKALFVSYGGETEINYFNQTWAGVTGVTYEGAVPRTFSRAGYYTLQSIDTDHPIFSVFTFDQNKLPQIKFFVLPKFSVSGEARPIMVFTGNRPALVETRFGKGKVLCFTGPISPEYTDLPGHAFFVPFVSRIAEYLASDLSTLDLKLYSGDNITRSLALSGAVNYPAELITPDSNAFYIPPEEDNGVLVLRVKPADQPGIYRINYLGREIDRFAVNVRPTEGNLAGVDAKQFAASLGTGAIRELGADRPLEAAIAGFRFGRELRQIFLWIAAVLVAVEILLARGTQVEE